MEDKDLVELLFAVKRTSRDQAKVYTISASSTIINTGEVKLVQPS